MIERLLVRGGAAAGTRKPRGLVLVPTRELALQVHKALCDVRRARETARHRHLRRRVHGPQIQALRRGTDIVVATPGRLIDHMQRRTVDLSAIEILTLDEADRMLDMGFLPPLRRILAVLPRDRQTLMFSATLSRRSGAALSRTSRATRSASTCRTAGRGRRRSRTACTRCRSAQARPAHARADASAGRQALVFCKTKRGSNRVGEHLERAGVKAAVIHGNKSQGARTRALGDFKAGRVTVLVATDIAARGLDIVQLPLVVNYDLPLVAEDYVHRVGRTGRAGLAGRAVSLVSAADATAARHPATAAVAARARRLDGFPVVALSHEALPEAGRRQQGGRQGLAASAASRPSGPRPSRPGGSSRRPSSPRRSFARS